MQATKQPPAAHTSNVRGHSDLPLAKRRASMTLPVEAILRGVLHQQTTQGDYHPTEEARPTATRGVIHPTAMGLRGGIARQMTNTPEDPTDHQEEDRQMEDHQLVRGAIAIWMKKGVS